MKSHDDGSCTVPPQSQSGKERLLELFWIQGQQLRDSGSRVVPFCWRNWRSRFVDVQYEAGKSLDLILQEIDQSGIPSAQQSAFRERVDEHFPALFEHLIDLYGSRYDAYVHIRSLIQNLARFQAIEQPAPVPAKTNPWYQSQENVGIAVYVDLFAGDLQKLIDRIPYLEELGITY